MSAVEFDFSKRLGSKRIQEFAQIMIDTSKKIGFKVSSRGWCYIMEQYGYINKSQFDKVADAINRCRKNGMLPVDFVAEESARAFSGVEVPSHLSGKTYEGILRWMLSDVLDGGKYYTPDWWKGEEYYIQMVVEKVDLVTLFKPVCAEYHIPIANSKGWSSILQRAEYAKRFAEAEQMGLKCVLLYCGDHDPDGLRISETLRSNLRDVSEVVWADGGNGYDPHNLIIDRFGLNFDFIEENNFTWIDNLITGSGKNLASKNHVNYGMPYVQEYLKDVGERKCEANVVVTLPDIAKQLCTDAIEKYVGDGAWGRFRLKRLESDQRYEDLLNKQGLYSIINEALDNLDADE